MSDLIRVGITHGDINGVGYEVILKTLDGEGITELFTPVIFGVPSIAAKCREMLGLNDMQFNVIKNASEAQDGKINLVSISDKIVNHHPGDIDKDAGKLAVEALETAVTALKDGSIDVLVTGPISKEAVHSENFSFPGHTEFLENRLGKEGDSMMILCNNNLRVALLTIHIPISKVSENITFENIVTCVEKFSKTLTKDFGCVRPSIAVLSLNPHSGDGGIIGREEEDIIKPALVNLRDRGILVFGPYAADGFFGHGNFSKFDGVLAMYHDQGLAPYKTLATNGGVNFTAGLPYVRTSPDHGTAFDIAWKGEADPASMREAIYMAIDIYRRREIFDEVSSNPLKKYMNEKPDKGEKPDKPVKRTNITEASND